MDNASEPLWHTISPEEAVAAAGTTMNGLLSEEDVVRSRQRFGQNVITAKAQVTFLQKLWEQVNNSLIWILIFCVIVSAALQQYADLGLILAVIILNVAIGLIQEGKAEKAADAIKAMLSPHAMVLREGVRKTIAAQDVVHGDVVFIQSGDRVPADVRLISGVANLQIMEAVLTGESLPVPKDLSPVPEGAPLGDRRCMAFSGTLVTMGQGIGVVVAIGDSAEIGKINSLVSSVDSSSTPLIEDLEVFGTWLAAITVVVAVVTFFIAYYPRSVPLGEAFGNAVGVAVAIIPEGLPAVTTITLALGVQHMARKNAIIRQLPAVETLGAVSVICTDKTGTLTKNEMTVVAVQTAGGVFEVTGSGYDPTTGTVRRAQAKQQQQVVAGAGAAASSTNATGNDDASSTALRSVRFTPTPVKLIQDHSSSSNGSGVGGETAEEAVRDLSYNPSGTLPPLTPEQVLTLGGLLLAGVLANDASLVSKRAAKANLKLSGSRIIRAFGRSARDLLTSMGRSSRVLIGGTAAATAASAGTHTDAEGAQLTASSSSQRRSSSARAKPVTLSSSPASSLHPSEPLLSPTEPPSSRSVSPEALPPGAAAQSGKQQLRGQQQQVTTTSRGNDNGGGDAVVVSVPTAAPAASSSTAGDAVFNGDQQQQQQSQIRGGERTSASAVPQGLMPVPTSALTECDEMSTLEGGVLSWCGLRPARQTATSSTTSGAATATGEPVGAAAGAGKATAVGTTATPGGSGGAAAAASATGDADWVMSGDPTEGALLTLAVKAGMIAPAAAAPSNSDGGTTGSGGDAGSHRQSSASASAAVSPFSSIAELAGAFPRIDLIPFESEYKFMGVLVDVGGVRAGYTETVRTALAQVEGGRVGSLGGRERHDDAAHAGTASPAAAAAPVTAAALPPPHHKNKMQRSTGGVGSGAPSALFPTASTGGATKQTRLLLIKGAYDRIISRCALQAAAGDAWTPEPIDREMWLAAAHGYATRGMRVLALAQAVMPPSTTRAVVADVLDGPPMLQLNCLVAIVDPPRPEAIEAVRECHAAGITVKMITGDHPDTASTIGSWIGIETEEVLTGAAIGAMDEPTLSGHVLKCNIYARATPEHKLRIVRALQKHGRICAMTGDGVNDAPALKQANVGVAMGITGTDVAKEAAKMILADDNFATMVNAVREGRCVYDNLVKILFFALPTNFAQGICIVAAMIIGVPSPLTAIQVLYVNMITSVTLGLVLALEKPEPDVMQRPPRNPKAPLLSSLVAWRTTYVTALFVVTMLGNYQWTVTTGGLSGGGGSEAQGRAAAMNTLVLAQCLYAVNCRYRVRQCISLSSWLENPWVLSMIAVNMALQVFLNYTPGVQGFFNLEYIDGLAWLKIILLALGCYLVVEVEKALGPRFLYPVFSPVFDACWAAMPRVSCKRVQNAVPPLSSSATGLPRGRSNRSLIAAPNPAAAAVRNIASSSGGGDATGAAAIGFAPIASSSSSSGGTAVRLVSEASSEPGSSTSRTAASSPRVTTAASSSTAAPAASTAASTASVVSAAGGTGLFISSPPTDTVQLAVSSSQSSRPPRRQAPTLASLAYSIAKNNTSARRLAIQQARNND